MLCNIHCWVFNSIISYQTSNLVFNHFSFMYQAKKFGAKILFIPYFSLLGPPSHSPCLLVSAVSVTFLLEPPARSESSSIGLPLGNTNQLSIKSSQNSLLQLWYWQAVHHRSSLYVHTVPKKASFTRSRQQLHRQKCSQYTQVAESPSYCLMFFRSANKICNFWPLAERLDTLTSITLGVCLNL